MARRDFSEQDLVLLGYTNIKTESESSDRTWKIFSAEAIAGIQQVTHRVIYLLSSCTKQDAERLVKSINISSDFFVITTRSGLRKETLQAIFGSIRIDVYEDLIWDKIQAIFEDYVHSLDKGITAETYYVAPRSEDSKSSPHDRLDRKIISYLEGREDVGGIRVVSASAGVGKTTLSREVVKKLAEKSSTVRVIPTYVESSHWDTLQLKSVEDLWDIIRNSLSTFSPNLTITEDLFKHALKQGYLVFIFDGFDELCGPRESNFSTKEVLDWLIDIAKETNARIVITTRTIFWDSEVGETPKSVILQKLRPFEKQQAREYFQKFFRSNKKYADKSAQLYKKLIEKSQRPREQGGGRVQFVNLPLCVGMIAQFVKDGGDSLTIGEDGTIIEQFLIQILERERVRQNIKLSAKDQLTAFEEIAVYCVENRSMEFDSNLLLATSVDFSESDITSLKVHPFLHTTDNKKFRFSYAFLESYLLASHLAKNIATNSPSVWEIMKQEANGKSYVFEHLVELLGSDTLKSIGKYHDATPYDHPARSFLFHVARTMVEERTDLVTTKEKTNTLFSIIGETLYKEKQILKNLFVIGTMDKLDFSGVTIQKSKFQDVTFHKCRADSRTRFTECRFSGDISFEGSTKKHWAQVVLEESCVCEPHTNLVWEGILNSPISGKKEHIKDAMSLALGKFWYHGRFKASIRKQYWKKGTLGHSVYCDLILETMISKGLLSKDAISGVHEGGYHFSRSAIPDLQRFMDNRQLTGVIKEVYEAILHKENH